MHVITESRAMAPTNLLFVSSLLRPSSFTSLTSIPCAKSVLKTFAHHSIVVTIEGGESVQPLALQLETGKPLVSPSV
jgi:hypothetical protein